MGWGNAGVATKIVKEDCTVTHTEPEQAKAGIGARVPELRKARGLTQERIGKLARTNQAVIQKIENGWTLRPRMVDGPALTLDVNPAWIQWGNRSRICGWIFKFARDPCHFLVSGSSDGALQ